MGRRPVPGLPGAPGRDRRAIRPETFRQCSRRPDLPHRGSGPDPGGWKPRVSRSSRSAAQGAGIPGRARGDRSRPARAPADRPSHGGGDQGAGAGGSAGGLRGGSLGAVPGAVPRPISRASPVPAVTPAALHDPGADRAARVDAEDHGRQGRPRASEPPMRVERASDPRPAGRPAHGCREAAGWRLVQGAPAGRRRRARGLLRAGRGLDPGAADRGQGQPGGHGADLEAAVREPDRGCPGAGGLAGRRKAVPGATRPRPVR